MDEVILSVKHLSKSFEDMRVIDDVSFTVGRGEAVGLVGESGCGKSTAAQLISGLLRPDGGEIVMHALPGGRGKRRGRCPVNMVFQDPADSFDPHMTIFESLCEALRNTKKCSRREAEAEIDKVLKMTGLEQEYKNRKVSSLSGGQCQRAAIARAILTEPELLICDEVTSALDVSMQAQIIRLFLDLKKRKSFSYLFISHDLAVVSALCSRVIVMYKGRIMEIGEVREVLEHPCHPYTALLVQCARAFTTEKTSEKIPCVPQAEEGRTKGCAYYPRCSRRRPECGEAIPKLEKAGAGRFTACHFPL